MARRPGLATALAVAACALLVGCSASATSAGPRVAVAPSTPPTLRSTLPRTTPAPTPAPKPASATISASPAPSFTDLAFPTASAGWVLGTTAAGPARARIWHTGTAGSSWQLQWQGAGSPLGISATDPGHAWALIACPARQACGRELLATADGGKHWRVAATLPKAVNQVRFYSPSLGIATSDSCLADPALTRCPGRLLITRDAGKRWTSVLSGPGPVFGAANVTGRLWAAQTYPAPPGTSQQEPGIRFLTSTDGGRHWSVLGSVGDLGVLSPAIRVTLAVTTAGLAWAAVFDPLSCAMHGCGVADLLSTGDGGLSWNSADLAGGPPDECGFDSIELSVAPGGGAWAATGRNGGACSPPLGLLYRYPGSAESWQPLPSWQLTQVSALAAVTERQAYAISIEDTVSVTFDGGARWIQLLPALAPSGQVDAVTTTTALAAQDPSDAGAILRSDDGGRTWRRVAELPGVVTQLHFWSPSDGVAATYQPGAASPWELFESSDGGANWTPIGPLPGGGMAIDGPWMSASGHGLLLTVTGGTPWEPGNGGIAPVRIWTTSDYGRTWHRGALLPLGTDTVAGPGSFVYGAGPSGAATWTGWVVIATATGAQRVAAVTIGGPLRLLSSSLPAGEVQLLGGGVGVVWGLQSLGNATATVLSLYRTTDNGRSWQHVSVRLKTPANASMVLVGFSDADHGWLVLGDTTWRTADGGRAWTRD